MFCSTYRSICAAIPFAIPEGGNSGAHENEPSVCSNILSALVFVIEDLTQWIEMRGYETNCRRDNKHTP